MNCERAARWVEARRDGELDPRSERELLDHLERCASCAAGEGVLLKIREAIRAGAPRLGSRPPTLNPDLLLLETRRARRDEETLIVSLKRVALAAAAMAFASLLAAGWAFPLAPAGHGAGSSIQAVAASSSGSQLEAIIDEENSIMMALAVFGR